MAKIRIVGDSSGYVELAAPNAAGNNTLELPSNATKLVGADASIPHGITKFVDDRLSLLFFIKDLQYSLLAS